MTFHSFLRSDSAATIKKTIAAQNMLPVRSQTTTARSIAGRKTMNKPMSTMMMTPIMISINAKIRSLVRLPKID